MINFHQNNKIILWLMLSTVIIYGISLWYQHTNQQKKFEKTWYNEFATQLFRNITNPYQIKEKIYFFYATEYNHKNRMKNYCKVEVYTLNQPSAIKNLQQHLNYYDETLDNNGIVIENKDKNMITLLDSKNPNITNGIVIHSWIYNHQVSADMFDKYKTHHHGYRQSFYDRYLECLDFIMDIPHEKSTFAKADARTYVTDIKYPKINQEYLDHRILSLITNSNTLVKVKVSYKGIIYFYDVNQALFITLSFQPKF